MALAVNTSYITNLEINIPELNHTAEIYTKCHLTDKLLYYGLILGRNIVDELGIVYNFEKKTVPWQEVSISLKPPDCTAKKLFVIKESRPVKLSTKRIKQILNAEYKKIDLKSIIMNRINIKFPISITS